MKYRFIRLPYQGNENWWDKTGCLRSWELNCSARPMKGKQPFGLRNRQVRAIGSWKNEELTWRISKFWINFRDLLRVRRMLTVFRYQRNHFLKMVWVQFIASNESWCVKKKKKKKIYIYIYWSKISIMSMTQLNSLIQVIHSTFSFRVSLG